MEPTPPIRLDKFIVSIHKLRSLSKEELYFNIQIGVLLNEIVMLEKLRAMTNLPAEERDETLMAAYVVQLNFLTKILAGKLLESWELISKLYNNKLSLKYGPLLHSEDQEHLKALCRYFGRTNAIYRIRNQFAFHHASADLKDDVFQLVHRLEDSAMLAIYFAPVEGNCLYSLHHTLLNYLMIVDPSRTSVAPLTDEQLGILVKTLLEEITDVAKSFIGFAQAIIALFSANELCLAELKAEHIEINDPPDIGQIHIPFFVSVNREEIRDRLTHPHSDTLGPEDPPASRSVGPP